MGVNVGLVKVKDVEGLFVNDVWDWKIWRLFWALSMGGWFVKTEICSNMLYGIMKTVLCCQGCGSNRSCKILLFDMTDM